MQNGFGFLLVLSGLGNQYTRMSRRLHNIDCSIALIL